jgi:hypothetical protein
LFVIPNKNEDDVRVVLEDIQQSGSWIKDTEHVRALNLCEKSELAQVFDFNYMLKAATLVLAKFKFKESRYVCRRAVLWGQKNHGKSQLLHFLMVLFQNLGELVVFLDQSAIFNGIKMVGR